jgi:hypothetical protein
MILGGVALVTSIAAAFLVARFLRVGLTSNTSDASAAPLNVHTCCDIADTPQRTQDMNSDSSNVNDSNAPSQDDGSAM